MLTILFYEASAGDGPVLTLADVEEALLATPGMELNGAARAAYRPGRWRDAATGATCTIDLGAPPLQDDPLHPPRAYDGWREVGLAIHLPLSGPHWLCVESLQLVEGLLARMPTLRALDTEDTLRGEGPSGPGPWSRPRTLASWERLHAAQHLGRSDAWRMNRLASVCLWRYRRERAQGLRLAPALHWPESFALLDREEKIARSAIFWRDPGEPLALPPVELVILHHGERQGVLPAADLAAAAAPRPLPAGQAAELAPTPGLATFFAQAQLLPVERFRALGDFDWSD